MEKKSKAYAELRSQIIKKGLLDRQYLYYVIKIIFNLGLLGLSLYLIPLIGKSPWQIVNALFLGFIFTQIAGISHDAGHNQIAKSTFVNDFIALIHMGIFEGVSFSWWVDKHNAHHRSPNELDSDPDIDFPVVVFAPEQAVRKKGFQRFMVKYQTYFYPFLVLLVPFNMRFHSARILAQNKAHYRLTETVLMLAHYMPFFTILFASLGWVWGILFILIYNLFIGLYMSSIFAPNHKGMPIVKKNDDLGFLRHQVMTSRDVEGGMVTDFLYLGLNYQIEHHLFPNMPRNKLAEAQVIVRDFCKENKIGYYETSAIQSYKELFQCLYEASSPLRQSAIA
ncbi:MAG: acyl-CoA desaturase [bacterium]|nr:acyl-CoA desaturase [bacterium]